MRKSIKHLFPATESNRDAILAAIEGEETADMSKLEKAMVALNAARVLEELYNQLGIEAAIDYLYPTCDSDAWLEDWN